MLYHVDNNYFQGDWPQAFKKSLKGRCGCEYGYNFNTNDAVCIESNVCEAVAILILVGIVYCWIFAAIILNKCFT